MWWNPRLPVCSPLLRHQTGCHVCCTSIAPDQLLICSGEQCDAMMHMKCVQPIVPHVLADWLCPKCDAHQLGAEHAAATVEAAAAEAAAEAAAASAAPSGSLDGSADRSAPGAARVAAARARLARAEKAIVSSTPDEHWALAAQTRSAVLARRLEVVGRRVRLIHPDGSIEAKREGRIVWRRRRGDVLVSYGPLTTPRWVDLDNFLVERGTGSKASDRVCATRGVRGNTGGGSCSVGGAAASAAASAGTRRRKGEATRGGLAEHAEAAAWSSHTGGYMLSGELVWAKSGKFPWWPARIYHYSPPLRSASAVRGSGERVGGKWSRRLKKNAATLAELEQNRRAKKNAAAHRAQRQEGGVAARGPDQSTAGELLQESCDFEDEGKRYIAWFSGEAVPAAIDAKDQTQSTGLALLREHARLRLVFADGTVGMRLEEVPMRDAAAEEWTDASSSTVRRSHVAPRSPLSSPPLACHTSLTPATTPPLPGQQLVPFWSHFKKHAPGAQQRTTPILRAVLRAVAEEAAQSAMRRAATHVFDCNDRVFLAGANAAERAQAHARAAAVSESCAALAGIKAANETLSHLRRTNGGRKLKGARCFARAAAPPSALDVAWARSIDMHGRFSFAGSALTGAVPRGFGVRNAAAEDDGVGAPHSALEPLFWIGREVIMTRRAFLIALEAGVGAEGLSASGAPKVRSARLGALFKRRSALRAKIKRLPVAKRAAPRAAADGALDKKVCFGRVLSHDGEWSRSSRSAPPMPRFRIEFDNPLGGTAREGDCARTVVLCLALPHHAVVLLENAECVAGKKITKGR